jgi:hypothetical protein
MSPGSITVLRRDFVIRCPRRAMPISVVFCRQARPTASTVLPAMRAPSGTTASTSATPSPTAPAPVAVLGVSRFWPARNSSSAAGSASITRMSPAASLRLRPVPKRRRPSRTTPISATSALAASASRSRSRESTSLLPSGTRNSAM